MKRVLMDEYVTERNERKRVNGEDIDITTYQIEHCD